MTDKYYEYTCMRFGENLDTAKKWANGEKELGLDDSLFICDKGVMQQYVEGESAERFHNFVQGLDMKQFEKIVLDFSNAIINNDLEKMHYALAVFDEMDNYDLGTEEMKKYLLQIRKATHEVGHNITPNDISGDEKVKNFILYKNEVYLPEVKV